MKMASLEEKTKQLRDKILADGVMDDETVHHEFVSGLHGRKIDFDVIPTSSELYRMWIDTVVAYIKEKYPEQPIAVLGVANGGNRLAISVAAGLGGGVLGLTTEKVSAKSVALTSASKDFIEQLKPSFVLVVEDVGTAGTTSATAALAALEAGAQKVTVLNTWQRSEQLDKLVEAGVKWQSVIHEPMVNYSPEECEEAGYCANGLEFIPHAK
jgi:orotate phosphoribosyltransferase